LGVMRMVVLIASVLFIVGCAGGGGWPGQYGEDPTAYDFPIVEKRWQAASRSPLGSAQDMTDIVTVLKKKHPELVVREIRWLSATEVMALCVGSGIQVGGQQFYYGALEKNGSDWSMVAWYDGSVT
jgi:hypothetical protein